MERVKKIEIGKCRIGDDEEKIILIIFRWRGEYGRRFGYALDVDGLGPIHEDIHPHGDGFISADEAERSGREVWRSFRIGDEVLRGVFVSSTS